MEEDAVTGATAPHPFSQDGRRAALEGMATRPLDVLVIGGGITGVGIARDATLRFRVMLGLDEL